ncbi:MAG: transposase [Salinisphaeraceae bacterium]|nr:transposase [Salinisphaeraceae bacterium]
MSQKNTSIEQQNGQGQRPGPEVVVGPSRRQFSREYKLRILAEVEQCQRGEIGAVLRREGLYSSTVSRWRQQKAAGKLDGQAADRGRERKEEQQEIKRLRRENARLKAELSKKEAIIEVQKKLSALLAVVDD